MHQAYTYIIKSVLSSALAQLIWQQEGQPACKTGFNYPQRDTMPPGVTPEKESSWIKMENAWKRQKFYLHRPI